jgi:nicotinate-nucleotide adenylyltransferase
MGVERVAIYGGSFNPPHISHVLLAAYALSMFPIDKLLVIPCFVHPFAKDLAPYEERFAMCEAAMGSLPQVTISRVEQELGGESRSLRTLEHLQSQNPNWAMRMLIGADILADAPKWYRFEDVVALAPLLVVGRGGYEEQAAPQPILPAISSTEIRKAFATQDTLFLETFVPLGVRNLIENRRLYQ